MKKNIFSTRLLAVILAVFMLLSTVPAASLATVSAAKTTSATASAKKISKCKITVASSVKYTGKALKPAVKVKYGSRVLTQGKHYTVTYSSNKKIGVAKVTIKAIKSSGYTGSKTVSFKIVPAKATSLKATSKTTSSVKLTWKAVKGATGYVVYRYDAKAKKYIKVKATAKTTLTVSKLKAGTKYTFAVRAYTKVNKKNYYGSYSAKLAVTTKKAPTPVKPPVEEPVVPVNPPVVEPVKPPVKPPVVEPDVPVKPPVVEPEKPVETITVGKVTSLKAKKSGANVVLSWTKVSGASGYQISSYDASTKKYTVITTSTTNSATLKNLAKQKAYSLAVRAYVTSNGKNVYGAYSSAVVTTVYYADMYSSIFKSGTVMATFTADMDGTGPVQIKFATKNGNIYTKIPMPITETTTLDAEMLYIKKTNKIYLHAMEMWFDATSMMEGTNPFEEANIFSAIEIGDTSKTVLSTETVNGKKMSVETIPAASGGKVKLYISNGTLARITMVQSNGESNIIDVKDITSTVPDSLFTKPTFAIDIGALG